MFISREEMESRLTNEKNILRVGVLEVEKVLVGEVLEKEEVLTDEDVKDILQVGIRVNNGAEARPIGIQGKVKGDKNIPDVIRDIITIQSHFGKQEEIAKAWGVSQARVSQYKNGMPHPANPAAESNIRAQAVIETNVKKIRRVVEDKILMTLSHLKEDKLIELEAEPLTRIARNLSGIISGVENKEDRHLGNVNVQTIFYNPGTNDVGSYEIVESVA